MSSVYTMAFPPPVHHIHAKSLIKLTNYLADFGRSQTAYPAWGQTGVQDLVGTPFSQDGWQAAD